ncbi:MAG: ATP-binding protein [Planctomycetes bacterium]|nr:ATP-binding protein [Planctomycetota bacterium]
MFRSSVPVTDEGFANRARELARLEGHLRKLAAGAPSWVALIGPRKVGKTSLLLELARRAARPGLAFVIFDSFEDASPAPAIFRRFALRVLDAALGAETGISLETLARRPAEYRAALQESRPFAALPPALRALVLELPDRRADADLARDALDLPERLAQALRLQVVVAWDEFQELATLDLRPGRGTVLPLARSLWQKHRRVSYFISGSARTMLRELVTEEHSPFFQHFEVLELGPFREEDAVRLLVETSARGRRIVPLLARRAIDVIGGHPFYVQLLGETMERQAPPIDDTALKEALQELLFSRTGRLALHFENEFAHRAGRSTYLAAALQALADGPRRLGEVARAIGAPPGATVRYLERLGDAVARTEDGGYRLDDPTLGLWLRWRQPGGTVVPMTLLGDEAEQAVAQHLARSGFDLVYQSRASRGAFDLLALRGGRQLGIQVKRAALPVRFPAAEWRRMGAEGRRLGWRWLVAAVTPDAGVVLLDPARAGGAARARTGRAGGARGETLDRPAAVDNVLLWLDRRTVARAKARRGS